MRDTYLRGQAAPMPATAGLMTADDVRAVVAAKWPQAMQSPLAQAMHGASAMAQLEASDADKVIADAARDELRKSGREAAERCLEARDGWTVDTLSPQIECAVDGELDADECDELAREVLEAHKPMPVDPVTAGMDDVQRYYHLRARSELIRREAQRRREAAERCVRELAERGIDARATLGVQP